MARCNCTGRCNCTLIEGTNVRITGSAAAGYTINAVPAVVPTVVGSRGGNAALASLLTALAGLGLIVDGTGA